MESKKAISPVITTVLLILLVFVLASIIIVWSRSFMKEKIDKFEKPIEQSCEDTGFTARFSAPNSVALVNTGAGSIPIYKFAFKKSTRASDNIQSFEDTQIVPGASKIIEDSFFSGIDSSAGDKLFAIPILLGTNSKGEVQEFQCPEASWKQVI